MSELTAYYFDFLIVVFGLAFLFLMLGIIFSPRGTKQLEAKRSQGTIDALEKKVNLSPFEKSDLILNRAYISFLGRYGYILAGVTFFLILLIAVKLLINP